MTICLTRLLRPGLDTLNMAVETAKSSKLRLDAPALREACEALAQVDPLLASVYALRGLPPLWDRSAGFATLLHIILEQQVSLASAKACFYKLNAVVGETTPEAVLGLTDQQLRTIGFSRQKASYARHLAEAVVEHRIDLDLLESLSDAEVRAELTKLKGVGNWTADIYLLMAMLRPDVMPEGDLALHIAWQKISGADARLSATQFLAVADRWRPFRSAAARLLWHHYLSKRKDPVKQIG